MDTSMNVHLSAYSISNLLQFVLLLYDTTKVFLFLLTFQGKQRNKIVHFYQINTSAMPPICAANTPDRRTPG